MAHFALFADDTNIFVSGANKNEAYKNANKVLSDIHNYMLKNLLHINLNSNERLTYARVCEYGIENVIKIGNQKLKKVDKVEFLGIIIDDKLNWEPHIDHLSQKLKSSIIMIKRIMKFIPNSEYNKMMHYLKHT